MIRVFVVDDQDMVRQGFGALLDAEPDIEVAGSAADGAAAVDGVRALAASGRRPDVVLMDIRMPRLDGLEAARQLLAEPAAPDGSPLRVIMLTTFDLDDYVYAAFRAGASGFLLKDAPASELIGAIRVVAAGDALLAPGVTRRLIADFVRADRSTPVLRPRQLDALTAREAEVLVLVARGLSNAEIAAELVLSEQTVKTHVGHILTKLSLRDRTQAVVLAYETGLVQPAL